MEAITRDFFLFLSKNNLLNNIAKKAEEILLLERSLGN